MSAHTLTMDKSFTFDNLNNANLIWRRSRTTQRFGQFWMNKTGFVLPEDFKPGFNLWEEKNPDIAYGVIFDYLLSVMQS